MSLQPKTAEDYYYQGQRIRSESPLFALNAQPLPLIDVDLVFKIGPPANLEMRTDSAGWLRGEDAFGFDLPGTGRFVAQRGRSVYVQPAPGAPSTLVEQILLGTVFAIAMMQRQNFCLHGAVLNHQGRTVAFCGDSGEGKSTLAMALSQAGWRVLTDDLALLTPRELGFKIANNGRHLRLWGESLAALGYGAEGLTQISPTEDKYYVRAPLESDVEAARLDAICFLESGAANAPFSLEPVQGRPALALLRRHTYRQELLSLLDCDGPHLAHCCALLAAVPLWRFRRPRSLSRLNELVDFVSEQPALGGYRN